MPYKTEKYPDDGVQPNKSFFNSQRSDIAHEIIAQKAGMLERWALYIFLGILCLMLMAAWVIKYPDIIEAHAVLTADISPMEIILKHEGRVIKLFVQNNKPVKQNQVLAWMESPAKHSEVLALSTQVDSSVILLSKGQFEEVEHLFKRAYTNLGEIQNNYQIFLNALENFNDYLENGFYKKNKNGLMYQQLLNFKQAINLLKRQIEDWKKKYLLQAPMSGKISYLQPLQENQLLQEGKLLGFVIPDETHIYIEASLPQANFGKIDTGQLVQLRFVAYPFQEFGFVEGTVSYISNVVSDSGIHATIHLKNGLLTTNHKKIPFRNGLIANALVITKDTRLIARLWSNINKSVSVGTK